MSKYQNGKIYKIIDNTNGKIYIGSTREKSLNRRLQKHKSSYNCYLNPNVKQGKMASFDIIENGDFKIVLIEDCPCENKDQLLSREQYHIERNDCININDAVHDNKKCYKIYSEKNRDKLNKGSRDWVKNNKDKRAMVSKKYADKNKEKRKIHIENVRKYKFSFGGDIRSDNCNMLKINLDIFD